MNVYVIKDWDEHYENNRSKEIKNPSWIPIPNKLYGDGYTMIMEQKKGAAIYGAWIALVCIAQRCDKRGTLMRNNGDPHDIDSISRITRIDKETIKLMIDFSLEKTKWLSLLDLESGAVISQEGAVESQESVPIQKDTEQKDRDRTGRGRFTPPALEEVINYINEKNYQIDADKWYNHYTANGWMVGKNKMKDWKAAVRTWIPDKKQKYGII